MTETAARTIKPQEGPQEDFLASSADIVFYGGAAGGGKTFGLLMEPLRHINNGNFGAVIFRRTTPQIRNEGGLWDESTKLYTHVPGAHSKEHNLNWKFSSGATISFAHMEHEKNRLNWQGSQIPLIEFDELTHFTKKQFMYMLSRNRSTCGVRPYIRATMNPVPKEDPIGGWVRELIDWWIGEDGYAIPERSGVIRWFVVIDDVFTWGDSEEEMQERFPELIPKSFTFILSTVYDNKILLESDPTYLANLMALPLVEREQLLGDKERGGNWNIKPEAGKIFNRGWFGVVDNVQNMMGSDTIVRDCLFWDFAATAKEIGKPDPDYTAACYMRQIKQRGQGWSRYVILDTIAHQWGPAEVEKQFLNITKQKAAASKRDRAPFMVRWETEPGSAGKREAVRLARLLQGYDAKGIRPTGDKYVRSKPLAVSAENGDVDLLSSHWNEGWLNHMHGQPDWPHDDEHDAAAGAYSSLAGANSMQVGKNPLAGYRG